MNNEENSTRKAMNVLLKYLPFIEEMKTKFKGTAIEKKWTIMHDLIVSPKQEITHKKANHIEELILRLKRKEEINNQDRLPVKEETGESRDSVTANLYSEHSYSRSFSISPEHSEIFDNSSDSSMSELENDNMETVETFKSLRLPLNEISNSNSTIHSENRRRVNFENKDSKEQPPIQMQTKPAAIGEQATESTRQIQVRNRCARNELSSLISQAPQFDIHEGRKRRSCAEKRLKIGYNESESTSSGNSQESFSQTLSPSIASSKRNRTASDIEGFTGLLKGDVPTRSVISPSSPGSELWIYKSVFNIAFARSPRGFLFKCLIHGCHFQTLVKTTFHEHLLKKHESDLWNGFCNICMGVVAKNNKGIFDQERHLDDHVKASSSAITSQLLITVDHPKKKRLMSMLSNLLCPTNELVTSEDTTIAKKPEENKKSEKHAGKMTSVITIDSRNHSETKKLLTPKTANLPTSSHFTPQELEKANALRQMNVPPIICILCRGKFFVIQTFKDHMRNHQEQVQIQCLKCGNATSKELVHEHLSRCHNIGLFQCVYCEFGSDSFDVLQKHIAQKHPSKSLIFCERISSRNCNGSLKAESPSVVEATTLKCQTEAFCNEKYVEKVMKDEPPKGQKIVAQLKPKPIKIVAQMPTGDERKPNASITDLLKKLI